MTDTGIFTSMLNNFIQVATLGYASLAPEAMALVQKLIIIEIVIFGIFSLALGETAIITATVLKKLIQIGFCIYLIRNFGYLSSVVFESFAKVGILAGGSEITVDDLFNPSGILEMGFEQIGDLLFDTSEGLEGLLSPLPLGAKIIVSILILVAYFILGMMNFVIIIEFYVLSVCSLILLPFWLFRPTAYLAEGAIAILFRLGIKFMVFTFILGISYNVISDLGLSASSSIKEMLIALFTAITIVWMAGKIPALASNLMSGTPSLSGPTGHQILVGGISTAASAAYLGGKAASLSRSASLKQAANKGV
jgi:type IV secretion system protein TrbL